MHIPAFSEGQPAQFFNEIFSDLESGLLCLNTQYEVEWATDNCAAMLDCSLDALEGYGYNDVIPGFLLDLRTHLNSVMELHESTVFLIVHNDRKLAVRSRRLGEGFSVILTEAVPVPPMPEEIKIKLLAIKQDIEDFKRGRRADDSTRHPV